MVARLRVSFVWWVGIAAALSACLPRDEDLGRETRSQAARHADDSNDDAPAKQESKKAKQESKKKSGASKDEAEKKAKPKPQRADDDPRLQAVFKDDFERQTLGDAWRATSKQWKIENGRLCGRSARNHPVWLAYRLPTNAIIEFDATSRSADGDLKAEFWGDGDSASTTTSYNDATSYLTIFGGWKNSLHVLARIDEHGDDRKHSRLSDDGESLRTRKVVPDQVYRFRVERRDGKRIRWFVDDVEIHSLNDPKPLRGEGHEHFGFNDWEAHVCFDNLSVVPLKD